MDKNTAEMIVKIYAVLCWLGALFSVIGGIALMFLGSFAGLGGYGMMGGGYGSSMWAGLGVLAGIVLFALAVLYVFVGLGLWNHREWARITAIVLSVLELFSFPLGTIIGAF